MKKSVTLVELLISLTLLGVIVLGAGAFHLASERFLTSSEGKTQILNELSFVLQHLQKNILIATGSADNQGIFVSSAGHALPLIQGSQNVLYTFGVPASPNSIMFSNDGGVSWEELSRRFVDLGGPDAFNIVLVNGGVQIENLALRLDPAIAKDDRNNPEITTIDSDASPNRTVYFYSLAHSW